MYLCLIFKIIIFHLLSEICETFPLASFEYVEGAGNWVNSQKPKEFLRLLERFLGEEPDRFAFVPQGGGDPAAHHRCPGEPIATRLMVVALDQFVRHMTYTAVAPSAPVDFGRLPALPTGGYPIRLVATGISA